MRSFRRTGAAAAVVAVLVGAAGCAGANGVTPASGPHPAASDGAGPARLREVLVVETRYAADQLGTHNPRALAVGPDGNLYITDGGDHVTVVSPAGRVLRRWGGRGRTAGRFDFVSRDPADPNDVSAEIAVAPDGTVYVVDSGNFRVEEFDGSGRFVRSLGHYGRGPGELLAPSALATDAKGELYLTDESLGVLDKLTPTGKLVWRIHVDQNRDGDLAGFLHLGVPDSHGRMPVTNDANGRVFFLDSRGHKLDAFGGEGSLVRDNACGASVDAVGNVYIGDCGLGHGVVYDRTHHPVGQWTGPGLALVKAPRFTSGGVGWAITTDGALVKVRSTLAQG